MSDLNCACDCCDCNTDTKYEARVYLIPSDDSEKVTFGWDLPTTTFAPQVGDWIQHPDENTVWVVRQVMFNENLTEQSIYVEEEAHELDYAGHPMWEDIPEDEPNEGVTIKIKNLIVK